jgi:hypothetical protein
MLATFCANAHLSIGWLVSYPHRRTGFVHPLSSRSSASFESSNFKFTLWEQILILLRRHWEDSDSHNTSLPSPAFFGWGHTLNYVFSRLLAKGFSDADSFELTDNVSNGRI